jgi:hypothetical protein
VLSREFQHRIGDFLYRLGVNVYEALIREWQALEQSSVNQAVCRACADRLAAFLGRSM